MSPKGPTITKKLLSIKYLHYKMSVLKCNYNKQTKN